MSGDFSIVLAKLERAKAHAKDFADQWTAFVKSGAYGFAMNMDAEPPHTLHFRWKVHAQTADELHALQNLSLIFGDMLTNLRSTLDYLVWQLVLAANMPPTDEHAFPCVKDPVNWGSAKGRRLVGVEQRWVDEIEKLQPDGRTQRPERDLLIVLDHVNNLNKHRTLPPVVVTAQRFDAHFSGDIGGRTVHFDNFLHRPIANDVEFFSAFFDPPLDKLNLRPDTDPPLRIAFGDGLDHSDGWGYTNVELIAWVEAAIAVFEPAFPS